MLTQKLILSYSSKILIQFIQIAASIIVARIAGPTVLGTIAFGLAYVSMFMFVSELGLATAHIKFVSEGKNVGDCITTYSILKYFTTFLYFIVTLSFFLIQKFIFKVHFESSTHQIVIIIFLVMTTIQSLLMIPNMTFAAKTEQAKQDIPQIIRTIFLQITRIIVVLLGYRTLTLAFSNLISVILITPVIFYLFKGYPRGKFNKELAKKYIQIAIPMIIYTMSTTAGRTLDKVLLQFFTSSKEVGYYAAGFRIGGFILIIANSLGALFFPLFSQAIAQKRYDYVQEKIEKFERFSLLFIMPAVIFLAIYSDSIVTFVLGKQYVPSINVLSLITIAMFILVINTPYGNVITGLGLFKLTAKIHIVNLFVLISSLIIYVNPKLLNLKSTGAALAILTSNIFLGLMFRLYAKKHLPILKITKNFKILLTGLINYLFFFFIYNKLKIYYGNNFRLVFPLLYFFITYLTLTIIKIINKKDWVMLLALFDIKAMKKYIGQEIKIKKNDKES